MKGNIELKSTLPTDLLITAKDYGRIKFIDETSLEEKGAFLTKLETGQPYVRAYTINEDLTNNGLYTNYFFPKSTRTDSSEDETHYVITQGNLYLAHPVGSCVMTSTNTNPSTILGGGTWSLIDKRMSYTTFKIADMVTLDTTNCSASAGTITRCSDTIHIYGNFTPKVAITDNDLIMFTLNLSKMGISSIPSQMYSSMTDGGQATFVYNINASGVFTTKDVMVRGSSTASLAASYSPYYYCTIPVPLNSRTDSACNQFIWKRTA